jgi:hypothetical protein
VTVLDSSIGFAIIIIALIADHLQLRKKVERMGFDFANKADKTKN